METQTEATAPPANRIIAVGPSVTLAASPASGDRTVIIIGGMAVELPPALEAALIREYERGSALRQAHPQMTLVSPFPFPWPDRYSSFGEFINQALQDWLYGAAPVWDASEDARHAH